MLLPKDLLDDLEKVDRTMEHVKNFKFNKDPLNEETREAVITAWMAAQQNVSRQAGLGGSFGLQNQLGAQQQMQGFITSNTTGGRPW